MYSKKNYQIILVCLTWCKQLNVRINSKLYTRDQYNFLNNNVFKTHLRLTFANLLLAIRNTINVNLSE